MLTPKLSTIVVTGDHDFDFNIYLPTDSENPPPDAPETVIRAVLGGAGTVERVLSQAFAEGAHRFRVRLAGDPEADSSRVSAVWTPVEIGAVGKDPKAKVWRMKRSLSLGRLKGKLALPHPEFPDSLFVPQAPSDYASDILVVVDNGSAFRADQPATFKSFLKSAPDDLPGLVLLKTCTPVGHGVLWWQLISRPELADRLVVMLSVNDLRKVDIRVSQGISWERTALDLVRELQHSPALSCLRRARHVILSLRGEGALWIERKHARAPAFKLFFDPAYVEREWAARVVRNGEAYGYHSTFIAALASSYAGALPADKDGSLGLGIRRGLMAMRVLRAVGHGPAATKPGEPANGPDYPVRAIAGILADKPLAEILPTIRSEVLGSFTCVDVPAEPGSRPWRILESVSQAAPMQMAEQPLYAKARRIALLGAPQLNDVPHARFGKYYTADRDEIEALRNLKRLIEAYHQDSKETKPLSIAVFGPPGAGKSFGVKQIAETVVEERDRAFLEFNLSQFSGVGELIGAFHQVRDKVLEGKLPVVFWDEFDAQSYKWLQYLLAPMQDGKFQEGQLTHPIGRSIFVFAGATSYTCKDFGPVKPGASDPALQKPYADFVLSKGPDFISRLHGSLDVLGPNPRQKFNGSIWEDDPSDVCFPVRRAILLRSLLGLMEEKSAGLRLDIDPGLLAALLEVGHYRYGSRSFEKIVVALKQGASPGFHRSALPTDEVLEMNVQELREFKDLLGEGAALLSHAELLAAAIHANWLTQADRENVFRVEFAKLDDETKADNLAAAFRIPAILGLVGLHFVLAEEGGDAIQDPEELLLDQIDVLAAEEHAGWMEVRLRNGWKPVARLADENERKRQRESRLHDCLIAYDKLPQEEREKDWKSVLWYPKLAALAGFKIVARKPKRPQL